VQVFQLVGGGGSDEEEEEDEVARELLEAAEAGEQELVKNLLANPDADVNRARVLGVTPLMVAAASGHAPVVRLLLLAGANKSAEDADGLTACEWADGQPEIQELVRVRRRPPSPITPHVLSPEPQVGAAKPMPKPSPPAEPKPGARYESKLVARANDRVALPAAAPVAEGDQKVDTTSAVSKN
jgi:ankyrin repeat protein